MVKLLIIPLKPRKETIMKQMKKDLETVSKSLKRLIRKIEQMEKRLGKLEKVRVSRKRKGKKAAKIRPARKLSGRKTKKGTAIDIALNLIERSKKGVEKATLKKKTGATDNNLRTIIYRLMKQGKIKSVKRGVYVKA